MFDPKDIREAMELEITQKSSACKISARHAFGSIDGWHTTDAEIEMLVDDFANIEDELEQLGPYHRRTVITRTS